MKDDSTPSTPTTPTTATGADPDVATDAHRAPATTAPAATAGRPRRRVGLIAGIAAAGLGVIALTAGITLAVADEWGDDDDDVRASQVEDRADAAGAEPVDPAQPAEASDDATATADEFDAALEAALAAADGTGVESIEAERDGFSVDVVRADGSEVEVRVPATGDAVLGEEDRAEAATPLDAAALRAAIEAATADGGEAHSVSVSDEPGAAVEVTVIADGIERELLLDAASAVIGTER
ncbi:hypothetical protein [Homoserinibacter sp. YIM 151385]|uniref:hypothetical protein n=1 Tax=Homoserinibacter sp. YIM 151385 TaxID=2985506 RepID=UPI0022F0C4D4|nr:hypothetical protein [Homoserinibacter sp. YIM 151385]WBU37499.1 hypothetical protein OF852_11320 [Homoserinibacter sp. YIM 151385]